MTPVEASLISLFSADEEEDTEEWPIVSLSTQDLKKKLSYQLKNNDEIMNLADSQD